jgi:hypothetical protein
MRCNLLGGQRTHERGPPSQPDRLRGAGVTANGSRYEALGRLRLAGAESPRSILEHRFQEAFTVDVDGATLTDDDPTWEQPPLDLLPAGVRGHARKPGRLGNFHADGLAEGQHSELLDDKLRDA